MGVTPREIAGASFSKAMRGYKPSEVDDFCQKAAEALEEALTQADRHKSEIGRLKDKLEQFYEIESTLQNTLVTAQKTSEQLMSNARKEAELIVRDAELKGQAVREDFARLRAEREQFAVEFAALLESYLDRMGLRPKVAHDIDFGAASKKDPDAGEPEHGGQ